MNELTISKEIEHNITELKGYVDGVALATDEDVEEAGKRVFMISDLQKKVEDQRTEITKPIQLSLKNINSFFKKFSDPLEKMDEALRSKIREYGKNTDRVAFGVIHFRANKVVVITHAEELDRKFLVPDLKKIKEALLAGEEVAGAVLEEDKTVSL